MQESGVYCQPIVFEDLQPAQCRNDIFHALGHLNKIVEDVFGHIGERLKKEKERGTETQFTDRQRRQALADRGINSANRLFT